jgi:hypothetical protein
MKKSQLARLGLLKHSVQAQGGRVGVHSTPHKGSTFFAILPRMATLMEERDGEEDVAEPMFSLPPRPGAPSVLIIEDETKDRRPLMQAFTEAGYNEVLRAIRGEGPNREVPVIVITLTTEKEVGLGFPIHDVLNKPVTLEQLFSSLERIKKSPPQTSGAEQ